MADYVVAVQGIDGFDFADELPEKVVRAALRAVNRTAERARTASAREMREQVNFPASYLQPSGGRFTVAKQARSDDLEAIISGRSRPTSLARFGVTATSKQTPGVRLQVEPGLATFLPKAFYIRLRAGNDPLDSRSNVGLAIRLPEGQVPRGAYKPKPLGRGLWLLYGPAVNQVFKSVAEDQSEPAADFLQSEFFRLMGLDQ